MGGNIFNDTKPFDQKFIASIKNQIDKVLSTLNVESIVIGSAAYPTPGKLSNDLDLIIDLDKVSIYFNQSDPKVLRKEIREVFNNKGFQTSQSGISVHVKVPLKDILCQVDIMLVKNANKVAKFHKHKIPNNSNYKGFNKHLAIALLAKSKGMFWSPFQGLFKRVDGMKGDFITDDINEIAKILLNNTSKAKDLNSLETILKSLPPNESDELLSNLKNDPNWKEYTSESVNRIKKLSGIL